MNEHLSYSTDTEESNMQISHCSLLLLGKLLMGPFLVLVDDQIMCRFVLEADVRCKGSKQLNETCRRNAGSAFDKCEVYLEPILCKNPNLYP